MTPRRVLTAGARAAPLLLFAALWQAASMLGFVDPTALPTPVAIGAALVDLSRDPGFARDLAVTVARALGGLLLGVGVGVPLGAAMARHARAEEFFGPLVKSTYSLPKTALIPLLILWFGVGSTTNVVAVMLSTMLPLVVYTFHGVQDTAKVLIWSARTMGTPERELLRRVMLPASLPGILTGARIGLGFAFVIAIAAEMIAAQTGVGKLIFLYGENGAYPAMFAAVAAVVALASLADAGLLAVTRYALRWQGSTSWRA